MFTVVGAPKQGRGTPLMVLVFGFILANIINLQLPCTSFGNFGLSRRTKDKVYFFGRKVPHLTTFLKDSGPLHSGELCGW